MGSLFELTTKETILTTNVKGEYKEVLFTTKSPKTSWDFRIKVRHFSFKPKT